VLAAVGHALPVLLALGWGVWRSARVSGQDDR